MISFIFCIFPVYYISIANSVTDLLIGGLFLGVGGAVFSVGVTSLPKYYPKKRHGFINGIYGAGKPWDGNFSICCTRYCDKAWLGNNGSIVHGYIRRFYFNKLLLWEIKRSKGENIDD